MMNERGQLIARSKVEGCTAQVELFKRRFWLMQLFRAGTRNIYRGTHTRVCAKEKSKKFNLLPYMFFGKPRAFIIDSLTKQLHYLQPRQNQTQNSIQATTPVHRTEKLASINTRCIRVNCYGNFILLILSARGGRHYVGEAMEGNRDQLEIHLAIVSM